MYGKQENISYYSHKLLWGQGLYQELLFVFVEYDGKKSVLVSTDTTLDAFTVVELYAIRFGIEELFREYKQQVGGFSYHFWTASMPKLNHYSKKTDPDPLSEIRDSHSRNKILAAIRASEMFVFCSSVAMGILQLLALDNDFVKKFVTSRYLRTRSQEIPSEGTVMYYLRKYIFLLLGVQPDSFITQYIREKQQRPKTKDNKPDDSVAA